MKRLLATLIILTTIMSVGGVYATLVNSHFNGSELAICNVPTFTANARDGLYVYGNSIYTLVAEGDIFGKPEWSPDGRYIAYAATKSVDSVHVFVYDNVSKSSQQYTNTDAADYDPVWSHDGKYIAFIRNQTRNTEKSAEDLWIMDFGNPDSQHFVTGRIASDIRWHPTENKLIFSMRTQGVDVYTYNVRENGNNFLELMPSTQGDDYAPLWSADGNAYVFITGQYTYRSENGHVYPWVMAYPVSFLPDNTVAITEQENTYTLKDEIRGFDPSWSSDGNVVGTRTMMESIFTNVAIHKECISDITFSGVSFRP